ncbi:N-acetyltransferase [Alicyclobacillus sp. SO9]|uniref:N-acetyltransferase n=1 Tax=Alicyclobacillus sp. SO9 TaxID=2665646 RepID=UPI0018E7752E|nr:N-acetyltransferase [Alicyclobacillus sp. SO9]QQE80670.1 N-acetyltransferase [Alicyclobacillus sp. SO9]
MQIRMASTADVPHMQELIMAYAKQGLMLPRTEKSLYETLQCFSIADADGEVLGTAGLHILWKDLAEVRSLAVKQGMQGLGLGRQLVSATLDQARQLGIRQVLSLTYQTQFFEKLGFQVVDKQTLPHKIWTDCIHCKKFHHCDEVAMIYYT